MTRLEEWKNDFKGFINELSMPKDDYNGIIEYIDEAPNEPRWIPVSERLPEKNTPCLVSVGKLLLTQIAIYSDLMGTIDHRIFYQGDYGHENFVDITEYVKAWMPLPEPYEPQESEDEYGRYKTNPTR